MGVHVVYAKEGSSVAVAEAMAKARSSSGVSLGMVYVPRSAVSLPVAPIRPTETAARFEGLAMPFHQVVAGHNGRRHLVLPGAFKHLTRPAAALVNHDEALEIPGRLFLYEAHDGLRFALTPERKDDADRLETVLRTGAVHGCSCGYRWSRDEAVLRPDGVLALREVMVDEVSILIGAMRPRAAGTWFKRA